MQREKERGYAVTLDEDYADDVEQIVRARKPWPQPCGEPDPARVGCSDRSQCNLTCNYALRLHNCKCPRGNAGLRPSTTLEEIFSAEGNSAGINRLHSGQAVDPG